MLKDDLEFNCQPWISHSYYISTFQIHHINYPSWDFTKLKYNDALTPIIWRGQSHLDPHTDLTSTWLYSVAFRHCIRNAGSPALKHTELLASHYDDLRFERYLCPYASWVALDSRCSTDESLVQWWCIHISHLYAYQYLHTSWLRERSTYMAHNDLHFDKYHHPLMTYHLVTNMFKNYLINLPLSIVI